MKIKLFVFGMLLSSNLFSQNRAVIHVPNRGLMSVTIDKRDKFRDLQLVGDTCYGFFLTCDVNPKIDSMNLFPSFISEPGKRYYVSYTLKQIHTDILIWDSTWYWVFYHRNEPREYQEGSVMFYTENQIYQPPFSDSEMVVKIDTYKYFDLKYGVMYLKEYCNGEVCREYITNYRKIKQGKPSEADEYYWNTKKWHYSCIR